MAMTMKVEGMEEISRMLTELGNKAPEVAKKSLYEGAGIVADAFTKATEKIRTAPFKGKRDHRLPSPEEKAVLKGRVGIAKFVVTGAEVDTIIGIGSDGGYADVNGHRKAVRLIARSINSGTSFMDKQPVYRQAKSQCEKTATKAIIDMAEEMYEEIINGSL